MHLGKHDALAFYLPTYSYATLEFSNFPVSEDNALLSFPPYLSRYKIDFRRSEEFQPLVQVAGFSVPLRRTEPSLNAHALRHLWFSYSNQ